jgi:hypothetical protein
MVCSKGSSPTQSQLMHFQRANVAMSRARDQLVLFRSLDIQDIPSLEDMKIPILEFFLTYSSKEEDDETEKLNQFDRSSYHQLLATILSDMRYKVYPMGKVWKNGVCVEHPDADARIGILVECAEDSHQEWYLGYKQQKAIERVGWKCLRVDVVSLITRRDETVDSVVRFLHCNGISKPVFVYDHLEEDIVKNESDNLADVEDHSSIESDHENDHRPEIPVLPEERSKPCVVVSSDDEELKKRKAPRLSSRPVDPFDVHDNLDASIFGETVELDFLLASSSNPRSESEAHQSDNDEDSTNRRNTKSGASELKQGSESAKNESSVSSAATGTEAPCVEEARDKSNVATVDNAIVITGDIISTSKSKRKSGSLQLSNDDTASNKATPLGPESVNGSKPHSIKRYRRMRKYRRDASWFPEKISSTGQENDSEHSYDTDSDLKIEHNNPNDDESDWGELSDD